MLSRIRDERGGVAVLVAILMVPLIGVAALAIDLGMLVNERRNAQIAVDQAALAAAWADCNGGNPSAEGQAIGTANGFTTAISPDGDGYRANASSTIDAGFANVFGISTMTTEATAEAECRLLPDNLPALFAGSEDPSCQPTLDWSGSSGLITGDVHSNGDLEVTGSGNVVTGEATYVDDEQVSSQNPGIDHSQAGVEDIPEFLISQYAPGGSIWNAATAAGQNRNPSGTGNITINNGSQNGLYYTTGNITANSNLTNKVFTFVSNGGIIRLNGNSQTITRWDTTNQILAFATAGDCDNEVIQRIGSGGGGGGGGGSVWIGILYAPNGQIRLSGSSLPTVTGALIASTLDIQGSGFTVDSTGLSGPPIPTVRLTD